MKALVHTLDQNKEYYFKEGCYINELCNSAEDADVSIARARVEPGRTTRWHRLRGIAERYVILQGRGRVEIGSELIQTAYPGDVVVIPPQTRQRITNEGTEDLVFLAICAPRFVPEAYEDLESCIPGCLI